MLLDPPLLPRMMTLTSPTDSGRFSWVGIVAIMLLTVGVVAVSQGVHYDSELTLFLGVIALGIYAALAKRP